MADDAPSFADRSAQLVADFQHAMDSNAPVTGVLIAELKDLLALGLHAHADCAAMHAKMATLQAEASDMVKTIAQ
jgi:hypothetical protein